MRASTDLQHIKPQRTCEQGRSAARSARSAMRLCGTHSSTSAPQRPSGVRLVSWLWLSLSVCRLGSCARGARLADLSALWFRLTLRRCRSECSPLTEMSELNCVRRSWAGVQWLLAGMPVGKLRDRSVTEESGERTARLSCSTRRSIFNASTSSRSWHPPPSNSLSAISPPLPFGHSQRSHTGKEGTLLARLSSRSCSSSSPYASFRSVCFSPAGPRKRQLVTR
jgi:hypothetical protein